MGKSGRLLAFGLRRYCAAPDAALLRQGYGGQAAQRPCQEKIILPVRAQFSKVKACPAQAVSSRASVTCSPF
jgi:hypothetical protein